MKLPRLAVDQASPTADVDRWFLRRGLPLFIAEYDSSRKVWARALPFLIVVMLLSSLTEVGGQSAAMAGRDVAVTLGVFFGALALGNLARHRPLWSRPAELGWFELVAFVAAPAVPHLVDGEFAAALETILGLLVVLGLTWFVVSYGLVALTGWVIRRVATSMPELRSAAARALPMLLIFVVFLLYTTESWQIFARMRGLPYFLTHLLFVIAGIAFVSSRTSALYAGLDRFESWDEVVGAARDTPAAGLPTPAVPFTQLELSTRERRNVHLVVLVNQLVMAVAVAAVMGVFYLVLGFLTIDAAAVKSWSTVDPHIWLRWAYKGKEMILSEEHVRVAGFLAAFSGFYFAVYSASDPTLREGLADDGSGHLREALAARRWARHVAASWRGTAARTRRENGGR